MQIVTLGPSPTKDLGGRGCGDIFILKSIWIFDATHILATFLDRALWAAQASLRVDLLSGPAIRGRFALAGL